jgi:C-terminal processing protease CtpA/Prc
MKGKRKKLKVIVSSVIAILVTVVLCYIFSVVRYNGVWRFDAYGICYQISFGHAKAYHFTDSTVIRVKEYDGYIFADKLYCAIGTLKLDRGDDELQFQEVGTQGIYKAHLVTKDFLEEKESTSSSPIATLTAFYELFKENYAFFDLYENDFEGKYQKYKQLVDEKTDKETLYQYISDMVEGLNDGHISITLGDKEFSPYTDQPTWYNQEQMTVITDVIKERFVKDYAYEADRKIIYGNMDESTGYILLKCMGDEGSNHTKSFSKAMDKIMKQFKNKETIVFDLRFNSGGYDSVGLMIASYFTKDTYEAYGKQAYYKGEYTPLQSIKVKPADMYYGGKVILLTSKYTISAAETFVQDMIANPNLDITVIGEESAGFYSDSIPKKLGDDFWVSMSNECYYTSNGKALEGQGSTPDVKLPINYEDAKNGQDKALEWIVSR